MAKKLRDEIVFLEDILECIDKIADYISNVNEKEFKYNHEKQDAVIRRIEIIGEAVKRISKNTKEDYPNVPWREMAGMRDVVVHGYFGVTIELVWRVATKDIPELRELIEKIIMDKSNDR